MAVDGIRWWVNEHVRTWPSSETYAVRDFHRRLPGYRPTPLVCVQELADRLGVGGVWLKDESKRLGLPSFKILGASWAAYRALEQRNGRSLEPWRDVAELSQRVRPMRPLRLQAATDGNHGRAVAEVARWLDLQSRIYVPADTARARIASLHSAGADVIETTGSYDQAVEQAAAEADAQTIIVSDTSWPGYEAIPRWVVEGYSTIFCEADEQLEGPPVQLMAVQMGVGAFASAAVQHYRTVGGTTEIVGVEPADAACVLASLEAGERVHVPGPHRSVMAGLNCGLASAIAWPFLASGLRCALTVEDDDARAASGLLWAAGIESGESGSAGLAGLLRASEHEDLREVLRLGSTTRVLVVNTEGATDPSSFEEIARRTPYTRIEKTRPDEANPSRR